MVSPLAVPVWMKAEEIRWIWRARVTHCLRGDAGRASPLSTQVIGHYDVLLSCFCAESATGDRATWRRYVRNILRLLAPGGLVLTFSCSGAIAPDLFHKIVASAAMDAGVDATILERLEAAPDHAATLFFPEGDYLKGLVLRRR